MKRDSAEALCSEIASRFQQACEASAIVRVQCTGIPAPKGARFPGDYLWANCLCAEEVGALGAVDVLRVARTNLVSMLKVARKWARAVRGFVFVFACPGLPADEAGNVPRKLYIYQILSEGAKVSADTIDMRYVTTNQYRHESSQWTAVTALLA